MTIAVDLERKATKQTNKTNILLAFQIYRKTYGEHVGFKMFSDAVLLSLTRKVGLKNWHTFLNSLPPG